MNIQPDDLIKIIKDAKTVIDLNAISPDINLRDIGADSLDMMNIFLAIQEKYNVEIPDEEIENLVSIESICNYINKL